MLVNSVDYSGMLFLGDADLAYLCLYFVNDLEISLSIIVLEFRILPSLTFSWLTLYWKLGRFTSFLIDLHSWYLHFVVTLCV